VTETTLWRPLVAELDRWQQAGRVADLWLRDDDAIAPTPALERLLTAAARHRVPVTLAVIPAGATPALARRLAGVAGVEVAVHGWSHANHAPPGVKKRELGPDRPAGEVLAELALGKARLEALFGDQLVPVLVPPWNRIDPELVDRLPPLGFRALSVFGPERRVALPQVNSHVDIMDWHGSGGGRAVDELVADMTARLQAMRETGGVLGLLTHHLVHDEAAWRFVERCLAVTGAHAACRWRRLSQILPDGG